MAPGYRGRSSGQDPNRRKLPRVAYDLPVSSFALLLALLITKLRRCRQSLTVEAIAWTEFGLCLVTFLSTTLWIFASKTNPVSFSALCLVLVFKQNVSSLSAIAITGSKFDPGFSVEITTLVSAWVPLFMIS